MLFAIFKSFLLYLFIQEIFFKNMQISQEMPSTKLIWRKISQLICIRNVWFLSAGLYLMCYTLDTRGFFFLHAADEKNSIRCGEVMRKISGTERLFQCSRWPFINFVGFHVHLNQRQRASPTVITWTGTGIGRHVVYLTLMCVMVDITALYQRMLKNWKFWKNLHFRGQQSVHRAAYQRNHQFKLRTLK